MVLVCLILKFGTGHNFRETTIGYKYNQKQAENILLTTILTLNEVIISRLTLLDQQN